LSRILNLNSIIRLDAISLNCNESNYKIILINLVNFQLYRVLLINSRKLLNNNKQFNSIDIISRTKLIYIWLTLYIYDFNNCFLFVAIIVIIVAFIFAFIFLYFNSCFFVACNCCICVCYSLEKIFNYCIKYVCKLKKIETKLTIYNRDLILLLRICF